MSNELEHVPAAPPETDPVALAQDLDLSFSDPLMLLRRAALQLDTTVDVEPNRFDLEGLARVTTIIEVIRRDLGAVNDKVKGYMHAESKRRGLKGQFDIEGVGTFQRTSSSKDVWDEEAAWDAFMVMVQQERHVDLTTGEIEPLPATIRRLLPDFAKLGWRVTPFKDRGVDPTKEGIKERVPGRESVSRKSGAVY